MKKVRRNAHKKIAAILDQVTEVKVYSLDNGFTGEVIELNKEYLLDVLNRMHSSLIDNENGTYSIDVHSNLWYNLDTKVVENVIEESIQVESIETEVIEEINTVSETQTAQISYKTGTGTKGNGIEITFDSKPNEEVRNLIKSNGYRWGGKQRPNIWWAILSDETEAIAKQLTGENNTTNESIEENTFSYPEIEIDDNDNYTIPENIAKLEHEGNWIFRKEMPDHNKQIKEYFTQLTNEVKEIIQTTENEYIIYKLKKTLQYYKKHYHQNYLARLTNKANNPSWVVTGRAGRNSSRDSKYNSRYDKLMQEYIDLDNDYKSRISTLKNKIRKDKEAAIKEAVKNTNVELIFKTVTKEGSRFYCYGNYAINKNWGTFKIYYNGKEIHSMKTTENLNDAKKYVSYLVQSHAS